MKFPLQPVLNWNIAIWKLPAGVFFVLGLVFPSPPNSLAQGRLSTPVCKTLFPLSLCLRPPPRPYPLPTTCAWLVKKPLQMSAITPLNEQRSHSASKVIIVSLFDNFPPRDRNRDGEWKKKKSQPLRFYSWKKKSEGWPTLLLFISFS